MKKKQSATDYVTDVLGLDASQVWDTELAFAHLQAQGKAKTKRTAERRLNALGLLPQELTPELLRDENSRFPNRLVLHSAIERARSEAIASVRFGSLAFVLGPALLCPKPKTILFWA
jgi:sulfate adenylyltransferase subunit 2